MNWYKVVPLIIFSICGGIFLGYEIMWQALHKESWFLRCYRLIRDYIQGQWMAWRLRR